MVRSVARELRSGAELESWNGAHSEMKPERAMPADETQTEVCHACGASQIPARDERTVCERNDGRSRGGQG